MKTLALVAVLTVALVLAGVARWKSAPTVLVFPNASSRETYFTLHNILPAQGMTKGKGAKVGILDHYFALEDHPDLYAGGMNFLGDGRNDELTKLSSHGYWMALVLHEVAPEARIYALNVASSDEQEMVDAIS